MRKIKKILFAVSILALGIVTTGCTNTPSSDDEKINETYTDLKFESKTFTFDGNAHSIEVMGLPNGVNVTYENNGKTNAGTYDVIAKLEDTTGKYNVPEELRAKLIISKKPISDDDISFDFLNVEYDGKPHSLEVKGLPEGFVVTYENNNQTEVGHYNVKAVLKDTTNNYIYTSILNSTLIIRKKTFGIDDLAFESKEFTYDGNAHSLEVTDLPEGVNVSYENNGKTNAGSYEVVAKLEDTTGNYIVPEELKATLKINKKDIANDISFESKEITYDGNTHSLEVKGLPEGVNVSYENNGKTNAGSYEVVAKLEDTTGNYIVPEELKATLKINKKDITNDISFESKEITYDGNPHSLEVTGLPEGVNALYENNGKVNAGSYEVVVKLDDTTGNYIIPNELKSTLKINKKDLTNDIIFDSKEITYDGNAHSLEVTGLPEGVNVSYENNSNINVGEYEVIAKLDDTTGNYIVPAELKN